MIRPQEAHRPVSGFNVTGEYLGMVGDRMRTVLRAEHDPPIYTYPRDPFEQVPDELSTAGAHRVGIATEPLTRLLAARSESWQWEQRPWARGRHHYPMQGRGWAIGLGAVFALLMLWLVLSLTQYEPDSYVTPHHGIPATTGETPAPPVAGRGAR